MVKFVQINHNFMNCLKSKVCFGTYTVCPSLRIISQCLFKLRPLFSVLGLAYTLLLLNGCSDDPVSVDKPIFRSQQFNWQTTEIRQGCFSDLWAEEANIVYLLNKNDKSLYKLSDKILTQLYAGDYHLFSMDAISENAIYIFGLSPNFQITFIKWNGSAFEYIPSGVFLDQYGSLWMRGCATGQDEAWICSQTSIIRSQGGNITTYDYPDSTMVPREIFKNPGGNIQMICETYVSEQHIQRVYELRNNSFTEMYELSEPYWGNTTRTFINQLEGNVYQLVYISDGESSRFCLKNYDGSAFHEMYCIGNTISYIHELGGSIIGELILYGETYLGPYEAPKREIYTWNGTFLSREIDMPQPSMIGDYIVMIKSVNPGLVHIMHNGEGFTTILTGTRK